MRSYGSTCLGLLVCLFHVFPVSAAEIAAQVVKLQGSAEIRDTDGKVHSKAAVGSIIAPGQSLQTAPQSTAVLKTTAGDTLVLDSVAATRMRRERNSFQHLLGKVLYLFTPNPKLEREVRVQTATMGIRGTTFLIDAEGDRAAVALKEGKLEITAQKEGFNLYQQKTLDPFETYKREAEAGVAQQKKEFGDYAKKVSEEFVAFKKSFQLESRQSLSLSGNKAVVGPISAESSRLIEELSAFAAGQ